MLRVATLLIVQHLLKEGHRLLLQILLHGRQIDPAAHSLRVQVQIVRFQALVDDLASSFELTGVPHKGRRRYQVSIVGHFFSLVHGQHERVYGLLVDISAPLVVEYERLCRSILDLSAILNARKLTNGLVDVTLVEDSVGFPENQNWILTLF